MTIWTELLDASVETVPGRFRTRILRMGSGPGLLLLHGQGGSLENFRHNIPAYAAHHSVVAMDLLWHGRSGTPPVAPPLLPTFLDQVEEVVGHLGWGRYCVEGQSLGGWVGRLRRSGRERGDAGRGPTPPGRRAASGL